MAYDNELQTKLLSQSVYDIRPPTSFQQLNQRRTKLPKNLQDFPLRTHCSVLTYSLSPKNEAFLAPTKTTKTKCTHLHSAQSIPENERQ